MYRKPFSQGKYVLAHGKTGFSTKLIGKSVIFEDTCWWMCSILQKQRPEDHHFQKSEVRFCFVHLSKMFENDEVQTMHSSLSVGQRWSIDSFFWHFYLKSSSPRSIRHDWTWNDSCFRRNQSVCNSWSLERCSPQRTQCRDRVQFKIMKELFFSKKSFVN